MILSDTSSCYSYRDFNFKISPQTILFSHACDRWCSDRVSCFNLWNAQAGLLRLTVYTNRLAEGSFDIFTSFGWRSREDGLIISQDKEIISQAWGCGANGVSGEHSSRAFILCTLSARFRWQLEKLLYYGSKLSSSRSAWDMLEVIGLDIHVCFPVFVFPSATL